ncbi:MAG: glycosyltransferase family 2 protein [Ignavibacteriae bacterium]|jgi:glycosyltransferase involved in cell wall biosynthesis|nr:glycosyltransferase family 2 protein [Ignavibacteriota bacterium]NOG96946.1 glycosyltransferase family 2 protein [Ignavibacteriota bacterium]
MKKKKYEVTNPNHISSIIIAKNEEDNIRLCIESQLKCIDDIVVIIDSKSTDKTLEIVKEYEKVKFEIAEWQGYAGTKQFALTLVKYNWVLWIDADEEITEELCEELNAFKKTTPSFSAYSLARRAFFLGKWIKHSGWYPGRVVRLFNKNKAKFSSNDVHEFLEVDGETGKLKNDINHYTDPNIHHYFEKFNIYTTLAAAELSKTNKTANLTDLLLRPTFLFIKMFFIRRGFLDGLHGFILAVFSSTYVFVKYLKLWEIQKQNK